MSDNPILWSPDASRRDGSAMFRFMRERGFDEYESLHRWSIEQPAAFWEALIDYCEVRFSTPPEISLSHPERIMHAGWFAGGTINYARHLLRHRGGDPALIFVGEDGRRSELSFDELTGEVGRVTSGLRAAGVGRGDRVGAILPNCPEAVVAMLATTSIGAVWTSCSPDFGTNGIVDRFGQIEPMVLITVDGYLYNGKRIDCGGTTAGVLERLPSVELSIVVPFLADVDDDTWSSLGEPGASLEFEEVPFDHPLFIMYSSGTTGVPKCIVHGHGGTLLKHLSEHVMHSSIGPADRLFYFTTCGWMMWNWLVTGLASGTTLVLFDGSPFFDEGRGLWRMAEQERVTVFGTSAKYISALEKAGVRPADEFELGSVRTVLSTGSPLAPASFDFVYDAIGKDIQLSSIAGGTDILGCFMIGNPILPVRRGELQCAALGMAVEVFDEDGSPLIEEQGELVCTRPFPSTPVGFWNDEGDERYRAAYFEHFPGVWAHGDFVERRKTGGYVIHGRSDAVLNPGGVRIGTAEIYRQVEKLDEIIESIAIGQRWDNDVRVVLFVVLREGIALDEELEAKIRGVIRSNTTPRHVPAKIVAVPDIPRTKSGKIVEIAVRSVVHGDAVRNTEALANPAALEHFADLPQLAEN